MQKMAVWKHDAHKSDHMTCTAPKQTMNMNSNSTRTDGGDTVTNKRKRGDGGSDDVLEQLGEMELDKTDAKDTSISTLPDTLLLHIFRFVLGKDEDYTPRGTVGAIGAIRPFQ